MKKNSTNHFCALSLLISSTLIFAGCTSNMQSLELGTWNLATTTESPEGRHESTFVEYNNRFYSLGGRRIKPISIFNPETKTWTNASKAPIELHHFQAISYQDKIWIMGAMTGPYPNETPVPNIWIYDPKTDKWEKGDEIPENRRRGGAGAVLHDNKFYLISGVQRGHMGGFVKWLDEYNPATGKWKILADAPRARDHFQAAVANGKIFAAGGRNTSGDTKEVFTRLVLQVDAYDFASNTWATLPETSNIPTPRAGTSSIAVNGHVLIVGGETARKGPAHNEVEALDSLTYTWKTLSPLAEGRHGTGVIEYKNKLWTCCGAGTQGGSKELLTVESADIK